MFIYEKICIFYAFSTFNFLFFLLIQPQFIEIIMLSG